MSDQLVEYLAPEDLLLIAGEAVGGEVVVRDHGLLASALARPQTTVFGSDAYPDLPAKGAALLHSLARNHPLVDGNRRLAWLATYVFLDISGSPPRTGNDEVVELVLAVAAGELDEVPAIAEVLRGWTACRDAADRHGVRGYDPAGRRRGNPV